MNFLKKVWIYIVLQKIKMLTGSLFQNILSEAEKQVGFKVQNCRLLVEAFFTSEGYIVFTLTRYKNEVGSTSTSTSTLARPKKVKFKRKTPDGSCSNAIYKFNTFEEFCNFCTYCNSSKLSDLKSFAKNISLYEYNNLYYLVFANINLNFEYIKLFYI